MCLFLMLFEGFIDMDHEVHDFTLLRWFNEDFPDTDVCPHKSDYCPECYRLTSAIESITIKQTQFKVLPICCYN